jgi:O-acetyl-ADP-ribose deacetylase (regulator of RNase III)
VSFRVIEGDLFAVGAEVLVCPTNAVGVMGAGLALEFSRRFPGLCPLYRGACDRREHDAAHPVVWTGPLSSAADLMYGPGGGRWPIVVCVATKRHWRDPSRLPDVAVGLRALRELLPRLGARMVALPALGCGLGGLCLDDVQVLMEAAFADVPADVVLVLPPGSATPADEARPSQAAESP